MADLIYSSIASLDGYVADENGDFDWAAPDAEVHAFVNDLTRPAGTYLYGRRMYDLMVYWETVGADEPAVAQDFAEIWRAAGKIVYSHTLATVSTQRTRLEREFDPAAVRTLKAASDRPLGIGGAELAGQALAAGLVDELQLFVVPHLAGGGTRCLPAGVRGALHLTEERRFGNGTVFLRYRLPEVE